MSRLKFNTIQAVTPREFCRIAFGISHLPVDEISDLETEQGYRSRCVALLANATGRTKRTVRSWGSGIKFDKMPECYQLMLGYALKAAEPDARKQVA